MPDAVDRARHDLAALVADGMKPFVSEVYPFEDTAVALERVASRNAAGRIVIQIGALA